MIITTTQLRGDQQPPIDDDNPDDIDEFIPLGVKNQPVTVLPKYFTNERDNTRRRIRIALSHNFLSLLSTLIFVIAFFFIHTYHSNPALEPGKSIRSIHFVCVYTKAFAIIQFMFFISYLILNCMQWHFVNMFLCLKYF